MLNPTVVALLVLGSLAPARVLNDYPDNEGKQFDKCLSEAERQEIARNGVLYKRWDGTYRNVDYAKGLLQIRPDTLRQGKYHFIKNGPWREYHKLTLAAAKYMKLVEFYDRLGNKLYSRTYLAPADTSQGFRLSTEEALDSVARTATYKQYYDNGTLKYIMFGRPLYFADRVGSYYKEMVMDSLQGFDVAGKAVAPDKVDTYNRIYFSPTRCR